MKQFSLEEYLKNPDRKVVTKSGDEATIIYTKANKEWPVVAMINSSINPGFVWQFSVDGESMPDNDGSVYYGGLFFADEELMEFKKSVSACLQKHGMLDCGMADRYAKKCAAELLELAKKELSEKGEIITLRTLPTYDIGFQDGKAEVLKDLPKWKKTRLDRRNAFGAGPWYHSGIGQDGGKHVVFINGYEISVDELFDKLPKED